MPEKPENNLITLKEAAKMTGYSADYIGQLIRSGKIPGKQIYTNITWMTTVEAVKEYKGRKKDKQKNPGLKEKLTTQSRRMMIELSVIKLFFKTFKTALPLILIIILSFIGICSYLVFTLVNNNFKNFAGEIPAEVQSEENFTF